jgi:hypothetical protein
VRAERARARWARRFPSTAGPHPLRAPALSRPLAGGDAPDGGGDCQAILLGHAGLNLNHLLHRRKQAGGKWCWSRTDRFTVPTRLEWVAHAVKGRQPGLGLCGGFHHRQPFRRRLPFSLHPLHEAPSRGHTHRPPPLLALVQRPGAEAPTPFPLSLRPLPLGQRLGLAWKPNPSLRSSLFIPCRRRKPKPVRPRLAQSQAQSAAGRRFPVQRTLTQTPARFLLTALSPAVKLPSMKRAGKKPLPLAIPLCPKITVRPQEATTQHPRNI